MEIILTLTTISIILLIAFIKTYLNNRNLTKIYNKLENEIQILSKHHTIKDNFTSNIIAMVDSNKYLAIQLKDKNGRYIFANNTLRAVLFKNMSLDKIIGRTDIELIEDIELQENVILNEINNLNEAEFVNINLDNSQRVCNLTDVITRSLKKPCRFFECVNGMTFDVYKTPIFDDNGNIVAIAGSLINISSFGNKKEIILDTLKENNNAFQLGKSENYYISDLNQH